MTVESAVDSTEPALHGAAAITNARASSELLKKRPGVTLSVEQRVRHSLHALVHMLLTRGLLGDEGMFLALAGRLHRWQREVLPAVAAVSRRSLLLGGEPGCWKAIPGVPLSALQELVPRGLLEPSWLDVQQALGPQGCSASWLDDVALTLHARSRLFPDGLNCRMIGLARPPVNPEPRSLAWSLWVLEQSFGRGQAEWLADPAGVDPARLLRALELASLGGEPTLLLGSSVGLAQALSALEAVGQTLPLATGSRLLLVERAGDGGHSPRLEAAVHARLGIPSSHVVSMLERPNVPGRLFTDALSAWVEGRPADRGWCMPPWMRACALDPETLLPLASGMPGMLLTVNLASVDRPIALLSEDVGVVGADQRLHFFSCTQDEEDARHLWNQPPMHWAYEVNLPDVVVPPHRAEGLREASSPGPQEKEGYGTHPQVLVAAPRLVV